MRGPRRCRCPQPAPLQLCVRGDSRPRGGCTEGQPCSHPECARFTPGPQILLGGARAHPTRGYSFPCRTHPAHGKGMPLTPRAHSARIEDTLNSHLAHWLHTKYTPGSHLPGTPGPCWGPAVYTRNARCTAAHTQLTRNAHAVHSSAPEWPLSWSRSQVPFLLPSLPPSGTCGPVGRPLEALSLASAAPPAPRCPASGSLPASGLQNRAAPDGRRADN